MNMSKEKDDIVDILIEDSYETHITALQYIENKKEIREEVYKDTTLWGNKLGNDFLFDIVNLLKWELDELSHPDPAYQEHKFIRVSSLLRNFKSELREKGDLEEALNDYIEELNEFRFTTSREGSYPGAPEIDIPITAEQIKERLYDIRRFKIEVYKSALEEYKKNKEEYNHFIDIPDV